MSIFPERLLEVGIQGLGEVINGEKKTESVSLREPQFGRKRRGAEMKM